jgi:Nucleotidyltransferase domain
MADPDVLELAQSMADRLIQVAGVAAVVLGGSWARNDAQPDSDVDLGIYHRPDRPLDVDALRRLARGWDDRHQEDLVTDVGGWGPWVNGGGWLQVNGRPVDWIYRDLGLVERVVADCLTGCPAIHHQPGHPAGFQTHIYLGELHHAHPLADPEGLVTALKAQIDPYPPALRQALIRDNLWQADFAITTARKSAARGEAYYVVGSLFRAASCLTQVLFAVHDTHFMNEKGSVAAAGGFPRTPPGFARTVEAVLGQAGTTPVALAASLERMAALAAEVRAIAQAP